MMQQISVSSNPPRFVPRPLCSIEARHHGLLPEPWPLDAAGGLPLKLGSRGGYACLVRGPPRTNLARGRHR